MIGYKGRLSFIQYMPKKHTKWGVRAYVLADSNTRYMYNWYLYTGMHLSQKHTHVHVCTPMHTCSCTYTCTHTHTHKHISHTCTWTHLHTHTHTHACRLHVIPRVVIMCYSPLDLIIQCMYMSTTLLVSSTTCRPIAGYRMGGANCEVAT